MFIEQDVRSDRSVLLAVQPLARGGCHLLNLATAQPPPFHFLNECQSNSHNALCRNDGEALQAEFLVLGNKADLADDDIKRSIEKLNQMF